MPEKALPLKVYVEGTNATTQDMWGAEIMIQEIRYTTNASEAFAMIEGFKDDNYLDIVAAEPNKNGHYLHLRFDQNAVGVFQRRGIDLRMQFLRGEFVDMLCLHMPAVNVPKVSTTKNIEKKISCYTPVAMDDGSPQ